MKKGLNVNVLRSSGGDCTLGGLSSKVDSVLLVSEDVTVQGPFEVNEDEDYMVLVRRDIGGEYLHAVPNSILKSGKRPMAGGNFIYTSDSRFPCRYPISVHDRLEN